MTTSAIIILSLFFIIILSGVLHTIHSVRNNGAPTCLIWCVIWYIPTLIITAFSLDYITKVEDIPVEYTTESTSFKIFVKQGDAIIAESTQKVDFDNWTKNRPGFIRNQYNSWGSARHSNFIVK